MTHAATLTLRPDAEGIACAAALLAGGQVVALPTETVYGLAADARNALAVARVYEAKGRPAFNPLIVHLPDAAAAAGIGVIEGEAARLAAAPAGRRYLAGWAMARELHVLNDDYLDRRAAGEDSLAALRGTAERLYAQIVIGANNFK